MKAAAWIDKVKAARGWESDYRVAKELGISRNTISNYRTKTPTLDEDTAEKLAAALGIDPAGIIIDQVAERSKNAATRATLSRMASQLCILCKVTEAAVHKFTESLPALICPPLPAQFRRSRLARS